MSKVKTWALWLLAALMTVSFAIAGVNVYLASADDQTADNTYLIPINGYADTSFSANDSGVSIWMTTNYGLGGEAVFSGLGDQWLSTDGGFTSLEALQDVTEHILINGMTYEELSKEYYGDDWELSLDAGTGAVHRVCMRWTATGQIRLTFHTDTGISYSEIETVTILEGFQWYSSSGEALGTGTDQDYTMYNDQTNNQFVRQLKQDEDGSTASDAAVIETYPDNMTYYKSDTFDKTGLSFTVTYNDTDGHGNYRTETITEDKIIVGDYDFSGDEEGTVDVPVYVQGELFYVTVNYVPKGIDTESLSSVTVTGIADSYTLGSEVTGLTLSNVTYTDGTTEDVTVTSDMLTAPTYYLGTCTGYITYMDYEFTFTYTVSGTKTTVYVDLSTGGTVIKTNSWYGIELLGVSGAKAIYNAHKVTWLDQDGNTVSLGDYIYINGESASDLLAANRIRRIAQYGGQILIEAYTASSAAEDGLTNTDYLTDETIYTVEFKAGIMLLSDTSDSWPGDPTSSAAPIAGSYLEEDLYVVRYPSSDGATGGTWVRAVNTSTGSKDELSAALVTLGETSYTQSGIVTILTDIASDAIVVTATDSYTIGEDFDTENFSVAVTYIDGATETLSYSDVTVSGFSTESAGTISYDVIVADIYTVVCSAYIDEGVVDLDYAENVTLSGLEESYTVGSTILGLTLQNVTLKDGSVVEIEVTDSMLTASTLYLGECTGTIKYYNLTYTFTYTVVQGDTAVSLYYTASATSIFTDTNGRLGVRFYVTGSTYTMQALEYVQTANTSLPGTSWTAQDGSTVQVGDYVYINGVSVTQLLSEYKLRKVLMNGETILFDVYTSTSELTEDGVPSEYIDSDTGMPIDALTYDTIYTIEFKPGFTWLTWDTDDWGIGGTSSNWGEYYYPVPGAYLTDSILLVRYPATSSLTRWIRPIALENGYSIDDMVSAVLDLAEQDNYTKSALDDIMDSIDSDAIDLTLTQTEYTVGDDFDATTLSVTVTYLDGGTDELTFIASAINGFDSDEEGECTCYVIVNTTKVYFTVTIVSASSDDDGDDSSDEEIESDDDDDEDDSTTKKGCGSVLGWAGGAAAGVILLAGAAIVLKKRKN